MTDEVKNFAYSTVATAPSPAASGTSLVVSGGDGTKFPTAPFNATVWPVNTQPRSNNAEIVRVTNVSTDTFTISRTQESSSPRSIQVGDQIAATITKKVIDDLTSAGGAPSDAEYVTISGDATLSDERVLTAGEGIDLTDGGAGSTITIDGEDASTTNKGISELATAAETTTGTDTGRTVTPDGLAGSDYGKRVVGVLVVDPSIDTSTGDGKAYFRIPSVMNGWNLVDVEAQVFTAGTTGTTDIQIRNVTDTVDMLSTKITIDSTEKDSSTAATPPVIDTANDDVSTADQIAIDIDAVSTTEAKGLYVELTFQLP